MSETKKLGQEPAFGDHAFFNPANNTVETSGMYFGETGCGMSKRFYAACAAMQGIIASGSYNLISEAEYGVNAAYKWADELLRQEANDE